MGLEPVGRKLWAGELVVVVCTVFVMVAVVVAVMRSVIVFTRVVVMVGKGMQPPGINQGKQAAAVDDLDDLDV